MRILHTMIRVGDLERSLAFYTEVLGMRLLRRQDYPEGRFTLAFVGYCDESEGAAIELTHNWDTTSYEIGNGFGHIALAVDDARAACAEIKAKGGKITREAGPMKHGTTVIAFVEDPDGYKIELIEKRTEKMSLSPIAYADIIFNAATPVIGIYSVGGKPWKRDVQEDDPRRGPWLPAEYEILNGDVWGERKPCLYLVKGSDDGVIRYVGISRNGMKDRWRESPAYDATTGQELAQRQLFHSQCWEPIEKESRRIPGIRYEVRCIGGDILLPLLEKWGTPPDFVALRGDDEGIVEGVERWLRNNRSDKLVTWNKQ